MADPTNDPQAVFRSGLPAGTSFVVVFVPSQDRDGQPIDQEYPDDAKSRVDNPK